MGGKDPGSNHYRGLKTIDELLERDRRREEDGFPRKIKLGRIIKPRKTGKNKIIIVPTTVREKLYHDEIRIRQDSGKGEGEAGESSGGTGDASEGEVIGEAPIHQEEGEGEGGAGEGSGDGHDVTATATIWVRFLPKDSSSPTLGIRERGRPSPSINTTSPTRTGDSDSFWIRRLL